MPKLRLGQESKAEAGVDEDGYGVIIIAAGN